MHNERGGLDGRRYQQQRQQRHTFGRCNAGRFKRLLARAEADDESTDAYNPDADDDEDSDDDGELEESFGTVERGTSAGEDINGGQLQISEFGHEMKQSFIEYSMSVITARALPDVRDGLKPVHRRILYAMNESGIYPNRPHKSPHGRSAKLSASTIRMAISPCTRPWSVKRSGSPCVCPDRRPRQLRQH